MVVRVRRLKKVSGSGDCGRDERTRVNLVKLREQPEGVKPVAINILDRKSVV